MIEKNETKNFISFYISRFEKCLDSFYEPGFELKYYIVHKYIDKFYLKKKKKYAPNSVEALVENGM